MIFVGEDDNGVSRLDDIDLKYMLEGNLDSMLENYVRLVLDYKARQMILNVDGLLGSVYWVYYKDSLLWGMNIKGDRYILELDIVLLLLFKSITIPDTAYKVSLSSKTEHKKFIADLGIDVDCFGDIHCMCPVQYNPTVRSVLKNLHRRSILYNYQFDYVGILRNYFLSVHSAYRRPIYTIGYCETFSYYVLVHFKDAFKDSLDWIKNIRVKNLNIAFDFSHIHKKDLKSVYKMCYNLITRSIICKYMHGMKELYISFEISNTSFIDYAYEDAREFKENFDDNMSESYRRLLTYWDETMARFVLPEYFSW